MIGKLTIYSIETDKCFQKASYPSLGEMLVSISANSSMVLNAEQKQATGY